MLLSTNDYQLNLYWSIQLCADYGNFCGMFEELKRVFGANSIKIAPLKSASGCVIIDCSKQIEWLVEHHQEFYSTENVLTKIVIEK